MNKPSTRSFTRLPQTVDQKNQGPDAREIEQTTTGIHIKPAESKPTRSFQRSTTPSDLMVHLNKELPGLATPVLDPSVTSPQKMAGSNEVGRVIQVKTGDVIIGQYNARNYIPNKSLAQLEEQILKEGQKTPAPGYFNEDGKVVLIDGQRRLTIARKHSFETFLVELRAKPVSFLDFYKTSRASNEGEKQTPLDDAVLWKRLLDDGVFANQTELTKELLLDPTVVSRTLSLNDLPRSVVEILIEHPNLVSLRMLDEMKKYCDTVFEHEPDEAKAVEACELFTYQVIREEWGARKVAERRMAIAATPNKRIRNISMPLKLEYGAGDIKYSEKTGTVHVSLSLTDSGKSAQVSEKIAEFLKTLTTGG